ncbi:MAG TPA: divalent-cation tolerance protein CutA [Methylovirgula sp.]
MVHAVLLTSLPDRAAAKTMAEALIAKRLAACVQMLPIESVYEWQGAVEEASEILLLCKMKREDYAEAEKLILSRHPYETPEIVLLPIEAGSSAYLAWIDQVTK